MILSICIIFMDGFLSRLVVVFFSCLWYSMVSSICIIFMDGSRFRLVVVFFSCMWYYVVGTTKSFSMDMEVFVSVYILHFIVPLSVIIYTEGPHECIHIYMYLLVANHTVTCTHIQL